MKDKMLAKKEREAIFELFTKNKRLKFNDIEKQLNIRSNHLSYHITKLVEDNVLIKDGEFYILTKEAERTIPSFAHMTGKEEAPVNIITAAILNKNKICLLKRNKRPYQGYWGLIGGKLKLSESVQGCAIREVKEETGLDCKFEKVASILHERVIDSGQIKHAFVIFLCKLTTKTEKLIQTDEGEIKWFDLKKLPENIIPSDKYMITKLLNSKFQCKDVLVEDIDGKFINMKVENGGKL